MSNLALFVVFLGVVWLGAWPWLASGLLYLIGLVANYFLHRRFSFGSNARHRSDIPAFVIAYGLGLVMSVGIVFFLAASIGPAMAQVLAIFLTAIVIYATLALLGFGARKASPAVASDPGVL